MFWLVNLYCLLERCSSCPLHATVAVYRNVCEPTAWQNDSSSHSHTDVWHQLSSTSFATHQLYSHSSIQSIPPHKTILKPQYELFKVDLLYWDGISCFRATGNASSSQAASGYRPHKNTQHYMQQTVVLQTYILTTLHLITAQRIAQRTSCRLWNVWFPFEINPSTAVTVSCVTARGRTCL